MYTSPPSFVNLLLRFHQRNHRKSALEVSSEEPLCPVCCDGVTMAVTAAFHVVGDAEVFLIVDVTMMSICLWRLYSK